MHSQNFCLRKPRKPILTRKRPKPIGKYTKRWIETRNEWLQQHPGTSWICYLCGRLLTIETLTLDHIKSRARHPELRFVLSNLAPCCMSCQQIKGSKDVDELEPLDFGSK